MWIDSHCHLDLLAEPPEVVLERARQAGVRGVLTIATDLASSARAVELTKKHQGVWAVVGVHPHDADSFDSASAGEIERLITHPRVVAIGEAGMDFYRDHAPAAVQQAAFAAQIEIARQHNLPLVMHIRDAFESAVQVLREVGPPKTLVFHCFSGGESEARVALDMGGYISFAGNVSFKSAENLRAAARLVPLDRLLVETDSPYLAPVPRRGRPNEPGYVPHVGAAVAQAKSVDVSTISEATYRNTRRAFSLPTSAAPEIPASTS